MYITLHSYFTACRTRSARIFLVDLASSFSAGRSRELLLRLRLRLLAGLVCRLWGGGVWYSAHVFDVCLMRMDVDGDVVMWRQRGMRCLG
jgi:hypothetical protein